MLVLCYGMQKSGSTLAFEMARAVLETAGYEQIFIRNDVHPPRQGRTYRNYSGKITADILDELIAIIGPSRMVAVKTHSGFANDLFPRLEELQAKRELQIIASYRDPRDICLSLLDAGEKERGKGKGFFTRFETLDDAARFAKRSCAHFQKWAALRGTLRLSYDKTAYDPEIAITAIESILGIRSDRAHVLEHTFATAFTQKNKAVRSRYQTEMTEAQKEQMEKVFRPFIRNACELDNQAWYENGRANILSMLGKT